MGKINLTNYEAFLLDFFEGNLDAAVIDELKTFGLAHPELNIDFDQELPALSGQELEINFKNELKRDAVYLEDEEVINYLEGRLTTSQQEGFVQRIQNDKALAEIVNHYKKTKLKAETEVTDFDKSIFLKTEDDWILNNGALAYFENQLNETERNDFESKLKTEPSVIAELDSYGKTKLLPEFSVVYPDKEALYKEAKIFVLFQYRTITAIAAAILLLFGLTVVFNYVNAGGENKMKANVGEENKSQKLKVKSERENKSQKLEVKSGTDAGMLNAKGSGEDKERKKNIRIETKKSLEKLDYLNKPSGNSNPLMVQNVDGENSKTNKVDSALATRVDGFAKNQKQNLNNLEKPAIDSLEIIAANNAQKSTVQTFLITETDDEEAEQNNTVNKQGFWKKAVALAKRVNKLGFNAVEGEERTNNTFALSFNSFSVEKK